MTTDHTGSAQLSEAAEAYAFRQLVAHLQARTDVQNIELMILSGFCRNCLSKWYHVGAASAGLAISYDDACERVYGMSYKEWKTTHQSKASDEQLKRLEETKAGHAKHSPPPPVAAAAPPSTLPPPPDGLRGMPAPPPPGGGLSDVCCVPADELVPGGSPACTLPAPGPPPVVQPAAAVPIQLGILTVSDRASEGVYEDLSGPEIASCMEGFAASPAGSRWQLATSRRGIVPDDAARITATLREWSAPAPREWSDAGAEAAAPCSLILTTGGTGLGPRDVTPEATSSVLERTAPGVVEFLLHQASRVEPLAALSRATAGVRGTTLIVNLPGRPKAVRENLAVLMPMLGHALLELAG